MSERYSQLVKLSFDEDFDATAQDTEATSGEVSISHAGDAFRKQSIGYSMARSRSGVSADSVILLPSQWSEYADRRPQRDRSAAIAAATGATVLALDMPGQSPNSSGLVLRQKRAYLEGDYEPLAADLWRAAEAALEDRSISPDEKEFTLLGMSQGATIAASMAATKPETITVSDVILWNSPSVARINDRDAVALAYDMARFGGCDNKYYQDLNPAWAYRENWKDGLRILRRFYNHAVLAPQALAGANDSQTIENAIKNDILPKDTRIHLVHATEDMVSTVAMNHAAEHSLRRVSKEVRRFSQWKEYHAITNYIGAVARTAADALWAKN